MISFLAYVLAPAQTSLFVESNDIEAGEQEPGWPRPQNRVGGLPGLAPRGVAAEPFTRCHRNEGAAAPHHVRGRSSQPAGQPLVGALRRLLVRSGYSKERSSGGLVRMSCYQDLISSVPRCQSFSSPATSRKVAPKTRSWLLSGRW